MRWTNVTTIALTDSRASELLQLWKKLSIDPNHFGINEYLGELYVNTNRIDKAKERLKILESCNCEEFEELKNAIKQGSSKY